MITITVKVFNRHSAGDSSYRIETHEIKASCLSWWKEHSGKGSFVLLSWY